MNNNFPPNPNDPGQPPFNGQPNNPRPGQQPPDYNRPPLVGLGGWMAVFQVYMYWGLFVSFVTIPAYIFIMFIAANPDIFPADMQAEVNRALSVYDTNLQSLSSFELVAAGIKLVLLIILLVLLYTRKRSFPRMARLYLLINLALVVLTFFIVPPTVSMVSGMIWTAVITLLWNLYFSRSVRVRNTFIR
ncbi:DUF2569 family protein [Paenibacillus sp. WLX1005]|uniref:DUF2569 family protein n=1 Tax=Paenibacillus sp. WLX1005 TaxID=3243766 RepID=UPI003983FE58